MSAPEVARTIEMTASFTLRPAIDEDQYRARIPAALAEINACGNLLTFEPDRTERLALLHVLSKQGLIAWNRMLARYELSDEASASLTEAQHKAAG